LNQDNIWAGMSSFAVEMSELKEILELATSTSLILGDEVCSGTESLSATAIVSATLQHFDTIGANFVFATHLHDLLKVQELPHTKVWHLKVERTSDGKLIYDRTLQPGSGSALYGLEVARAMGLPLAILDNAAQVRRILTGSTGIEDAPTSSWNTNLQRHICEVCKSPFSLEVHHMEERAKGGSNVLRNLVVLCEECHDKHHAKTIEIGPLRQTSDGLERSTVQSTVQSEQLSKESKEMMEAIHSSAAKFPGRFKRILLDLEEHGISISLTKLKRLLQA
jgi:DNA mismatch repair protein MutS